MAVSTLTQPFSLIYIPILHDAHSALALYLKHPSILVVTSLHFPVVVSKIDPATHWTHFTTALSAVGISQPSTSIFKHNPTPKGTYEAMISQILQRLEFESIFSHFKQPSLHWEATKELKAISIAK